MSETIYVVFGRTGAEEEQEWIVCAFRDEEKAKTLVENATRRANEIFAHEKRAPYRFYSKPEAIGTNEFDPHMLMDYTGTTYRYSAVELRT